MDKLRIATIGTNFIAESFLAAVVYVKELELAGVYSRTTENGKRLLKDNDHVMIFTDLNELAKDPTIDIVYIASPTSLHMEHSIKMLEAGKHVICEKPMASHSGEYKLMQEIAKKNNVVLFEAMRPLYHPSWKTIQEGIKTIGRIHKARFNFCQYSSRYDKFKDGIVENAFKPELSNGALMDIGIYCIEAMLSLFGKPKEIDAYSYIIPSSIDAYGTIIASYEKMICHLDYSKITNSETPSEIAGEEGTLYFDKIACPSKVWIKRNDGKEDILFNQEIEHDMRYEILYAIKQIRGNIREETHEEMTKLALLLTDEVRMKTGIVFPADDRRNK